MDDRTRIIPAVRRARRRRWFSEHGLDLVIVGLIMFIAGFVTALAVLSVR